MRCRLVQDENHGDNPANQTKSESTSDNQLTVADGDNYQGGTPSQELRSMTKGISTAGMSSDRVPTSDVIDVVLALLHANASEDVDGEYSPVWMNALS